MTIAAPKKSLGTISRKAVDLTSFKPVLEKQLSDAEPLPLIMEPASDQVDLAEWIRTNRECVANKISQHGGVLFRGFGIADARQFERVAGSICHELFAEYGDLPREDAAAKVYTSTPYPEDKSILYHNESSHLASWPLRINFLCLTVAKEGGATPIVDCRKVYRSLDESVREKFTNKGVMYVRNFCEGLDVSWQKFFGTEDRPAVEAACSRMSMSCEWTRNNNLRVKQRCRAVVAHPATGELSFFNQIQLHHVHCLEPDVKASLLSMFGRDDMPRNVYYGDGEEIEDSVMDHVGEIYERHAVRFQWQQGDLVSLDNMLTAHARDPYVGPRKIIVALGDMVNGADQEG